MQSARSQAMDERDGESWTALACVWVGLWLVASPAALGYSDAPMAANDRLCGLAAVGLGLFVAFVAHTRPRIRDGASWLLCLLGVWMLHAPLVFWTPSPAAYQNASMVGILWIAFSVVIPRRMWRRQARRPEVPQGWTFNPSSWAQRTPIIALAWINFLLARYLAAYQLGHIPWPWDPFFGDGTQRVLDSAVSEAFPVSDAGLGAAAYALEFLIGYLGDTSRWRTAPWTVALFGVLVVPVGVVSTVLMILQPVAVGAWCTVCLITAALMLGMACLALPEVVAMIQYLARSRSAGRSLWRTFWLGGEDEDGSIEERPAGTTSSVATLARAMVCGTTLPWTLLASTVLGVGLVAASGLPAIAGRTGDAHVIAGALVIVISIVSMSEVLRRLRLANAPVAVAMAALAWLLGDAPVAARVGTTAACLLLIALSLPRGSVHQRYGSWDLRIR